jgi:hypothetical protein
MTIVRKVSGKSIFIIAFLCLSFAAAHGGRLTKFPGRTAMITSPDGKYELINKDSTGEKEVLSLGGNHALYLRNSRTGEEKKIYSYDRHVEVLWSPKGTRLLINDYRGSDYSVPVILSLNGNENPVDIQEQLNKEMKNNRSIFGNHHVYVIGTDWMGENKLKIEIYGYGDVDPNGFTLWYEYTIGDGFKVIKKES